MRGWGRRLHVIEPRNPWENYLALPYLSSETQREVLWDNRTGFYNLQPSPGGKRWLSTW
jgi:hypothetical protein